MCELLKAGSLYCNLAAILLSGVILAQAFEYARAYPEDPWILKGAVLAMNFGNWTAQYGTTVDSTVLQIINPFISAIAQVYFTHRTYATSKNLAVVVVIGTLILVTLATGVAACAIGLHVSINTELQWVQINAWLSAVTDVAISSVFIYAIAKLRRPVSQKEYRLPTHSLLGKLLVMSFETATLSSTFAVLNAIFSKFLVAGDSWGRYGLILSYGLPSVQVM
ncbi:hypothetical protein RQP46_007141 [Phenoliferia psychrophenolica]